MIVLLTDFGPSEYVGVMKGVIHRIDGSANIVDLTHSISSQSVREAAWVLLTSYRYFQKNTIFVCVVDPGVGTSRAAVLVETSEYVFIGPDNGILYPTLADLTSYKIYNLHIGSKASHTFHGRDIFAVAAGRYHSGTPPAELGVRINKLSVPLNFTLKGNTGEVVRIDHFGNIITNLLPTTTKHLLLSTDKYDCEIDLFTTYAEGPDSGIFAVVGSAGTIELSAKRKRAIDSLQIHVGDLVTIKAK